MPLDQAIAEATGAIDDLPTVKITGLDVLLPGRHTGVKGGANDYTTADLEGIAQAHAELAGVINPVGKLGHRPQDIVAEYPNIGNITRAYVANGRLKIDMDNVPARVAALQKAGNLPARSAELLFNVQHNGKTYPKVLTGLAFLGESLPAVRTLNDVLARYQSADTPAEVLLSADDVDNVQLAAPTKTEDGQAFSKADYAYTPSDTPSDWKLRLVAEPGGAPDAGIVGAAAAALGAGFRGEKVAIPDADLAAVKAKVRAAWQKANPDKKPDEMPKSIALAAPVADDMSDSDKAEQACAECENPKHADLPPALHKKVHMPKGAKLAAALDELDEADLASGDTPDVLTSGGGSMPPENAALTTDYAPHLAEMQSHIDAIGDLLSKVAGKNGVGPVRSAHRQLNSNVAALKSSLVPPESVQHAAASAAIGALSAAPTEDDMADTFPVAEIRALLSLSPDQDIKQALIRLQATHVELADHQAVVAERDSLRAEHEAMLAAKVEADAVALADKAIADTKVLPKQRDWFINLARKDRESAEVFLSSAPSLWQTGEIGRSGEPLGPAGEPAGRSVSEREVEVARKMRLDPSLLADKRSLEELIAEQEAAKEQQRAVPGNARQFSRV